MNYIAEKLAEFKNTSNRIFKGTDYDFWFLVVKPYFDSKGLTNYLVRGKKYSIEIVFPNGGVIKFTKGASINDSLKSLVANDEAISYIYNNVHQTYRNGFLYIKESDSSITFILNVYGKYSSINVASINSYICINAVLKGMSATHLFSRSISGDSKDHVDFFYDYLSKDYQVYGVCTHAQFLMRAFGDYSIGIDSKGTLLVRASSFTICEANGVDWIQSKQIKDWVMRRIPSQYRVLIDFI